MGFTYGKVALNTSEKHDICTSIVVVNIADTGKKAQLLTISIFMWLSQYIKGLWYLIFWQDILNIKKFSTPSTNSIQQ